MLPNMTISAMPVRPTTVSDLVALVGTTLGPTAWEDLPQPRVDDFATVTGDHQWIHVEPARAAAGGLGGTIVHGLLTLSLGPALLSQLVDYSGFAHGLNYGYDKVRFPAPLPVGSRVRMTATVTAVSEVPGGAQMTTRCVFEGEGQDKPVCVADSVSRFYASS